jgi:pimeloyl-ACP methyl ester carboxylesterase
MVVILDFDGQDFIPVGELESVLIKLHMRLGSRLKLCNLPATMIERFNWNQLALMFQIHIGFEDALAAVDTTDSILDHPAISGRYLFPQQRYVDDPFMVEVDGAELACYRKIIDPDSFTMVHFHGNGEAVADYVPDMADVFAGFGLNSLFVEYREYGGSTGKAQLVVMLGDGEAAMKAAGLEPEKVIVFGRSIGSLYAIELVHRQPAIAGLILESGIADPSERFLTYADLSAAGVTESDVLAEAEQHFNHQRKLSEYRNPLLIMHTENDGLIDISHAERNYQWAGSTQKRLLRFPVGNHNTIFGMNFQEYSAAVSDFVDAIQT